MSWNVSSSVGDISITNKAWVTDGVLGKYTAGTIGIYKCPGDSYLSPSQRAAGFNDYAWFLERLAFVTSSGKAMFGY